MPRKPSHQARLDDVLDRAIDVGIDAVFERATEFFQGRVDSQRAAMQQIPQELRRAAYKCSGCHNMFPFEALAMISAKGDGFATCERCFKFMWHAGNEKMLALKNGMSDFAKNAARGAPPGRAPEAGVPKGPKPWEVLGVDADAPIDEIKKAYRKLAGAAHPDRVPPGAPSEEKEAARARFEEIDRAFKVMMKVRSVAT
jgi:DnaJ-domain-containing protein 1